MSKEGKSANYKDLIELKTDDHWVLSFYMQTDDGNWQKFMAANYQRKDQPRSAM